MPSKKSDDQKLADRATNLYWRSGQSVNRIAETMDLSKSGLYAMIRPLPAGRSCPDCGEALTYPNRTALQKTIASCLRCNASEGDAPAQGNRTQEPNLRIPARRGGSALEAGEAGSELEPGDGNALDGPGRRGVRSSRTLWAAILLGLAAGLYVAHRSRSAVAAGLRDSA
jgi:hypothetical protein